MAESIGILGGTFDPIHFGHLRPALDAADQLGLDRIHLIPSARPPHRSQPQATPEQRLTMLQLAVKNNPQFVVDDRELHREGNSYTVDTLQSLRKDYPESPLYLMLGTDAFAHIQTWHRWDELLDLTHIVVMQRADEPLKMSDDLHEWCQKHLASDDSAAQLAGNIWPIHVSQLAISATDIRSKIEQGLNPQFLLPDAVIQLIGMLGLYKS
jgi:nicotinate-nucleotide adenylyltransferase